MTIPSGHQQVMPYLMLSNAKRFIDFIETVFGARMNMVAEREDGSGIMHAECAIGSSTIMFTDATEEWKPAPANLFIYVEDADKTYEAALTAGSVSIQPPQDKDYGRACGVSDPFGNVWWITSITR